MLDMGISYVSDRNEDGQVVYKLEPQLDVFIHYDNKRASDVPAARFNLRQLISKELEAESVRRAGDNETDSEKKPAAKTIGNLMKAYKATPKEDGKSSKDGLAVDFFGRPIVSKAIDIDENEAPDVAFPPKKKAKVLYKYHEGFSNAVRINLKVSELFRA